MRIFLNNAFKSVPWPIFDIKNGSTEKKLFAVQILSFYLFNCFVSRTTLFLPHDIIPLIILMHIENNINGRSCFKVTTSNGLERLPGQPIESVLIEGWAPLDPGLYSQ